MFRNLLRKRTVEQALDDELRSSVEILTEEKMKEGLSPSVAPRRALIELGGVEQVKEGVRAIRAGRLPERVNQEIGLCWPYSVPASWFFNYFFSSSGVRVRR
jgi:hypothetical protein